VKDFNEKTCLLADRTGTMLFDVHYASPSRVGDEDYIFREGHIKFDYDLGDASIASRRFIVYE
jgi:hypothetical protein